ncbi:cutinase family protein [Nocardia arizonensis]|uniref:cutinase family protein n=1 Tax=Nocardia arizonensis TaxID=1141647 RepID=UPI0006D25009
MRQLVTIVACVAATATPTVAAAAPATDPDCPAVAGIFLPGTWETGPDADEQVPVGLLAPLATALRADLDDRFEARYPAYAAVAFDGMPYAESKATGVGAATRALREIGSRCPATRFVLAGYSQGADALGDVAATIGCTGSPVPADRVLAVGLIADPRQGTAGATFIGPPVLGAGLAGPRAGGFCDLAPVTAQICAVRDKYCATESAASPLLSTLGRLLSQPTGIDAIPTDPATAALDGLLSSDFADVNLPALATGIDRMASALATGSPARTAAAAGRLTSTLRPLRELSRWATRNPAANAALAAAAPNAPEALAAAILDSVAVSDLDSALTVLEAAGDTDRVTSADAARAVTTATAPLLELLAAHSEDAVRAAWHVLARAWPSALIDRFADVAADGVRFADALPAIGLAVTRIAAMARPGADIAAVARELSDLVAIVDRALSPLLRTAGDNLFEVSRILGLVPDATGSISLAAQLVRAVAEFDIAAMTERLIDLRDALWRVTDALAAGAPPAAIVASAAAVPAAAAEVLAVAVTDLGGAAGAEMSRLADTIADGDSARGLDRLVSEALSTAVFVVSGAHQSYGSYVVDADGTTAVDWLARWFVDRIARQADR